MDGHQRLLGGKGRGIFHLKGEGFFHLNLLFYRTDTVLYLCNIYICENTYFDLQKINSLVFWCFYSLTLEDYNFLARLQIYRVFVWFYNIGGLLSTENFYFLL